MTDPYYPGPAVDTSAPDRPVAGGPKAGSVGSPPRRPGRKGRSVVWTKFSRWDLKLSPYLYIAPFFVLFLAFGLFPLGYTFWVSLHDWEIIGDREFIGLANYTELFRDDQFWNAVVNTLGIFVLATVPQLVLALLLAHTLNRKMRGRIFFRMGSTPNTPRIQLNMP